MKSKLSGFFYHYKPIFFNRMLELDKYNFEHYKDTSLHISITDNRILKRMVYN